MTPRDDRFPDMPPSVQFDAAIEQALRGDAVGDDVATFARFVDDARVMADRPPPPPSPALTALLAGSAATREATSTAVPPPPRTRSLLHVWPTQPISRRWRPARIRLRVAAVPIAGKAAAVLLAVATAATAGAAAGVLPEPATHFVRRAIEVVTPFELPGDDDVRPGHAAQRVDHPSAAGTDPNATAMPAAASRPAAIAADAGDAHDPGVEAVADPQSEPPPADEASSWAETYPEPDTSARPTTPNPPTSSPPQSKGPKKAAPPDAGSPTDPGPKTGHVPPGHASPGAPRPGGPASGGNAPLFDPDPNTDRPGQPAGKGRPARPEPSGGPPSNPARERPQHGPPPGAGLGTGSNEEAPPSGPPPAAGHRPSARGGRDHAQCGQSRADAPGPADCASGAPHDPARGPGGDTGPARAVDAAVPEPPLP
jgi:hypothetical protein